MKLNCVIIEDEPLAMERTCSFVQKLPALNLIGSFHDSLEGMEFLSSHSVDLIFLDINMDQLNGIQLLENVKIDGQVIITTAYDQYALKGYELSVTDYLLKPFTFERFIQAVDKAKRNIENQTAITESSNQSNNIFIKTENRLEKIEIDQILYIEGMRDYRRIHTASQKIMTLQTFSELEKMITPAKVCRVHKSWMVGINHIKSIERSRIYIDAEVIPISESYRESFYDRIN